MPRFALSTSFAVVALCFAGTVSSSPLSAPRKGIPHVALAPLLKDHHPYGSVNDSYIVVFKPQSQSAHLQNHLKFLATVQVGPNSEPAADLRHVYDSNIRGYAGRFAPGTLAAIRAMPEVAYVEHDQLVRTQDVQKLAPWGLARISHRERLTFTNFNRYEYDGRSSGEGVDVYVIDTGINLEHADFEGRAKWGKTIPSDEDDEDASGHGTHCAGTIAGSKYGVAKRANLIAVKVVGQTGFGPMSDIVAGVVWASEQASAKMRQAQDDFRTTGASAHKGSVANLSVGGGKSSALDDAVNSAVTAGMHFAVAAGDDNTDACTTSPASAELAITVGASTLSDERAYFSNYGPCVDVFAPGMSILSTYIGSQAAVATLSGTSMAAPHTAGLLAYLLSSDASMSFVPRFSEKSRSDGAVTSIRAAYQVTFNLMLDWLAGFLPSPAFFGQQAPTTTVNIAPGSLTPADLKQVVLGLATKGALSELPERTPNYLIFNNATIGS